MYYVYILKYSNGEIYTGCTENLRDRIDKHNKGYVKSTKKFLPVKLINYIAFSEKDKAYLFEKYLKSGSGKAFLNKHLI
jgi:predicted GIY-YIG superfamily endonuclease